MIQTIRQHMYSVRDSKAEVYNVPFYFQTHGEAERSFTQVANDPKTNINQFPEDFDLYHLGTYDQITGIMTPLQTPQHMLKAIAVVKKPPQPTGH